MCCFKSINLRILESDDIKTLEVYSEQMKQTLKLIEEGNAEVAQVANEADLLKANESVVVAANNSGLHSPNTIENSQSAVNIS